MGCCVATHRHEFLNATDKIHLITMMQEENNNLSNEFTHLEKENEEGSMSQINYLKTFVNYANSNLEDLRTKAENQPHDRFVKLKVLIDKFYNLHNKESIIDLYDENKILSAYIISLNNK